MEGFLAWAVMGGTGVNGLILLVATSFQGSLM